MKSKTVLSILNICNFLHKNNKFALSDKLFIKVSQYHPQTSIDVTENTNHEVEWEEIEEENKELDKGRQGEPTSSGWVNPRKLEPEGHGQNVSADEMNSIEAQNHPDQVDGSGAKVIIPDTLGNSAINDPTFLDRFEDENKSDDPAINRLPNNRVI